MQNRRIRTVVTAIAMLYPAIAAAAPQPVATAVPAPALSGQAVVTRNAPSPLSLLDCDSLPGSVVRDDGTYEIGYSGSPEFTQSILFLDKFTPQYYPATYTRLCLALDKAPGGVLDGFDFDLLAYDDDGPDGSPGTLLGSLPQSVDDLPESVGGVGRMLAFDISELGLDVEDGSIYLGVGWRPDQYPQAGFIWMEADSAGGPPSDGYLRSNDNPWESLLATQADFTHFLIRAVERAPQPALQLDTDAVVLADRCASNPSHTNGIAEPGEIADLVVPVYANTGDFSGVVASLGLPAPAGVTYLAATSTLGEINDGNLGMANFRIRLEPTAACLQSVHLPVTISSDQGEFIAAVDVAVGKSAADVTPHDLPLRTNANASAISSTLQVAQSGVISDLRVRVDLRFYTVDSVKITLTSPLGTTVTLLDRPGYHPFPGCENTDVHVTFADGGPDAERVCDPDLDNGPPPWPVSTAAPTQPLALFDGQDMQGVWTLSIYDYWVNLSLGTLEGWELLPTPAFVDICETCTAPDAVFADGFDGA